jgi:hypothetical protein
VLLLVENEEELLLVEGTEGLAEELDDDCEVEDEELNAGVLLLEELEVDLIIGVLEEEEEEDKVDEIEDRLDELEELDDELDDELEDELDDELDEELDELDKVDDVEELEELVLVLETLDELVLVLEILEEVCELELLLRGDVVGDQIVEIAEQDVGTAVVVQLVVSCLLFFPPGTAV